MRFVFSEVIRSIFYAPHYIAMEKGFFREEGIEVDMMTSQGSDKGAAALLSGTADISLVGPESAVFIFNQHGKQSLKVFYQLDGNRWLLLIGTKPQEQVSVERLEWPSRGELEAGKFAADGDVSST